MVAMAATLVLSNIESVKITFTIERQLETIECLHDNATIIAMILSEMLTICVALKTF